MNRQAVAPDGRKQQGSANTGAFRYSTRRTREKRVYLKLMVIK